MNGKNLHWVLFLSIIHRGVLQNWPNHDTINDEACGIHSFGPKIFQKRIFTKHGPSHLFQSPILPLNNFIQLRGSKSREVYVLYRVHHKILQMIHFKVLYHDRFLCLKQKISYRFEIDSIILKMKEMLHLYKLETLPK